MCWYLYQISAAITGNVQTKPTELSERSTHDAFGTYVDMIDLENHSVVLCEGRTAGRTGRRSLRR